MSREKRDPLRQLPQLPATPRWAPSTPHAIRALQQRSGGRRKSAVHNRPDSARNILRQLAKITARDTRLYRRPSTPLTKPSTPINKRSTGGANYRRLSIAQDEEDQDLENGNQLERPDFTLPIGEEDEEEEEGLGVAPKAHELPDGADSMFRSIDFATRATKSPVSVQSERIRRTSRFSLLPFPDDDDDDVGGDVHGGVGDEDDTVQSVEYGRRAVSEGPVWDRYPRSSFGSIRMSEFGLEESRGQKELQEEASLTPSDQYELELNAAIDDDMHFDIGGDTEEIQHIRRSMSEPNDGPSYIHEVGPLGDDDEVPLEPDQDPPLSEASEDQTQQEDDGPSPEAARESASPGSAQEFAEPTSPSPHPTATEVPESKADGTVSAPHRKKLKLTKKGNTVPALPSSLVRRVAVDSVIRTGRKRPVIDRESLEALEQATEWFFEQVGEDLEAYADHAKRRKRIDDRDVVALMKRQRMLSQEHRLQDLAEKLLPSDVLCDLELPHET